MADRQKAHVHVRRAHLGDAAADGLGEAQPVAGAFADKTREVSACFERHSEASVVKGLGYVLAGLPATAHS